MNQGHEIEAKIELSKEEYDKVKGRFNTSGFKQVNHFYEFLGRIMRVREEKGNKIVCIKGGLKEGKYNVRKESEFHFDGLAFFDLFGLKPILSYKKNRIQVDYGNCVVCLDEIENAGFYLEVEGMEDNIDSVLSELGFHGREIERRAYFEILNGLHRKDI